MVELGQAARHTPELASILTTLAQGNFYERFLSIYACFGSADGAHVLRALTDPSRSIRAVAIRLVPLACDEEQMRQALMSIPADGYTPLLWKLRHHGHFTLIDDFLDQLAQADDPRLLKLLPLGSLSCVRRHIGRLRPAMRPVDWRHLTRHHPTITFELLQNWAASTPSLDLHLLTFANSTLPILSNKQPDLALTLVETLTRSVPLCRLDVDALLLQRPVALADFVLGQEDLGELDFSRVAHRLDNERLFALLEKHPVTLERTNAHVWLRRIQPERRSALFTVFARYWRDEQGCISRETIALLPREQREREGRRHLALSTLTMHPETRLPYAAFLPWDEAHSILSPLFHDPNEKSRTLTLSTLIEVVRYERSHLTDVLTLIQAHLHEPDPVCGAMLSSLAALPRAVWQVEHLNALEQIIQGTVNQVDASLSTIGALQLLITRVLACAPQWSAAQLAAVAQACGTLTFPYGCIERQLSDADVRHLAPALGPVLNAWAERDDEKNLSSLLSTFGKRVRVFDTLLDALEHAFTVRDKSSFEFGNTVLSSILTHRPQRAATLIPSLFERDHDWITYPAVLTYLFNQRQDLLTPVLADQKYVVRFYDTKKIRRIRLGIQYASSPLLTGFSRLTAHQQERFAQTLLSIIHAPTSDQPTIVRAIMQLSALPALPSSTLFALTQGQRVIVRDTAIMALSRLDTGDGMTVLREALYDERAVRAVYALRPFIMTMPSQEALTLLRSIPLTKITIAKEVIRLLGALPGEEAYQQLLSLAGQELHRDVRSALLRTLWLHLERDEAWHILEAEARSAEKIHALSTVRLGMGESLANAYRARKRFRYRQRTRYAPSSFFRFAEWNQITMTHVSGEHVSFRAQQRLMWLYALLLTHPEMDVRAATLRGCIRLPAADEGQHLLSALLEALDANDDEQCSAAASVIFGTCVADDAPLIGQAVRQILPNRRALREMVSVVQKDIPLQRGQFIPVVRAIIEALAPDPLTIGLRIKLAITALPWSEVASLLREAAATGILHADALDQAYTSLGFIIGRYGTIERPDSKEIIQLEEELATSHDERLRRIALAALITQAEIPPGWTSERRMRLQTYRQDSSVLVAAAAQFTLLPLQEDGGI